MSVSRPPSTPPAISLLWPPAVDRRAARTTTLSAGTAQDLDLERVITAISAAHGYAPRIREIVLNLCADPAVIRYRQDVLVDLVERPALAERLTGVLPDILTLDSFVLGAQSDQSPLHEVVWRVGQLESFVDCVHGLNAAFEDVIDDLRAEGLRSLANLVAGIMADDIFQNLVRDLPDLLEKVRGIASVTIGVNLDAQLRPEEATLLAVNNQRFKGMASPFFQMLFGRDAVKGEWDGLAPLHSAGTSRSGSSLLSERGGADNPLLVPLFRDLADVLKRISRPVAAALKTYARVNTRFLDNLGAELAFYLGAVDVIERMRANGLPMCCPEIRPAEARICEVEGTFNLNLALRLIGRTRSADRPLNTVANGAMVLNDVWFGDAGRIFVLTGPNQGGKTTYTQAAGLLHVLAQAGLYVPGESARLSPVDNVYTHFPAEERPDTDAGRLGEEAKRLSEIFAKATRHSLVLLNESLASTSPGEGLYLARDIVRILRVLGARAIYATHLHELAVDCDELNAETPGDSTIISLVSLAEPGGTNGDIQQTYRILPGPPQGRSYAREIAARYGISYEQLEEMLRKRGMAQE
jgi:DNA mismatch repair protein MutS